MKCTYCPHACEITENYHGFCGTKALTSKSAEEQQNAGIQPTIKTLSYGQITSIALDPIEKKPLRRFMPGTKILSIGSWGCNMRCPWCQNDSISRSPEFYAAIAKTDSRVSGQTTAQTTAQNYEMPDYLELTPSDIIREAVRQIPRGNIGIAYTYNEALTNYDFVYETAKLAHETVIDTSITLNQDTKTTLQNVLVTNGMLNDEYLMKLLPYIDALNVDLKTIDETNYKKIGGDLSTVLNTLTKASKTSHVEVTTLIVPGFNDTEEEIKKIAATLAQLDKDIPLHISRFFPAGQMKDVRATDVDLIYRLRDVASEQLNYVYTGNI